MTDDITDRVVGIVRNAERFDEQIAHFKGTARGKQPPRDADAVLPFGIGGNGLGGEAIGVNGERACFAEHAEAAGVVAVFVGQDDAGDLFEIATDEREALRDLATAEPSIDEQFRRVGFNQGAIARATAP